MKDNKKTYILSVLLCLMPVIAGLILLPKLPDQIVIHWDASGTPNGWANKWMGAVVLPGILLILDLLIPILLKMDPRYKNMSRKSIVLVYWIMPLVSIFCAYTTLANGLGIDVNVPFLSCMFVGLILTVIGNYLPKMTQSYTVGIKIPWTLNDEENWNKTHRMAGVLWMIGGILIMVCGFFPWKGAAVTVILVGMCVIPTVYSYLYYRRHSNA